MLKTIYTCIVGDYDDLKRPINIPPSHHQGWKFVCYTDNPNIRCIDTMEQETENIWEIRPLLFTHENPAKTSRWHKINFHKCVEGDSIWIDGTFFINIDLNRLWRRMKSDFTVIEHPFDDCAYTDLRSCLHGGKGDWKTLMRQANDYLAEGLPENFGLVASGILMRRKTEPVINFCEQWWEQVEKYTERDQPSFTYVYWKNPGIIDSFWWDYTRSDEFIHIPHTHKINQRRERFKMFK